jgi:hypothetical protein
MFYTNPQLPCPVTSSPEDGDSMFLGNVGIDLQIHTAPKLKTSTTTTQEVSKHNYPPLRENQTYG